MLPEMNTWLKLGITVLLCGIIGMIIDYFLLFGKKEKSRFNSIINQKLLKKGMK